MLRMHVKSAIQSLDVSCILHETEDTDRVSAAVRELVGEETPLELEELEGHFGNSIRKLSLHLHGEEATRAFSRLTAMMPDGLRKSVAGNIDSLVDEHSSLYLRFDKQRLVKGEMAAGHDDAVRLKVKPRAFLMHGRARDFFLSQMKVS